MKFYQVIFFCLGAQNVSANSGQEYYNYYFTNGSTATVLNIGSGKIIFEHESFKLDSCARASGFICLAIPSFDMNVSFPSDFKKIKNWKLNEYQYCIDQEMVLGPKETVYGVIAVKLTDKCLRQNAKTLYLFSNIRGLLQFSSPATNGGLVTFTLLDKYGFGSSVRASHK
jgi:hypothetical protein